MNKIKSILVLSLRFQVLITKNWRTDDFESVPTTMGIAIVWVLRHFHIDTSKIIKNINPFRLKLTELLSWIIVVVITLDFRNAKKKFRQMRDIVYRINEMQTINL